MGQTKAQAEERSKCRDVARDVDEYNLALRRVTSVSQTSEVLRPRDLAIFEAEAVVIQGHPDASRFAVSQKPLDNL